MRKLERRSAPVQPLLASVAMVLALTLPVPAEDVPRGRIEAVTLSSGGLAEIHRSASIDGPASMRIDVPLEQVDDILKSLVVRDPVGTIGAVTLDGLSPVEETFRRLPFTPDEMGSLPDLTASLQGVRIRASSVGRTVEGVVLGVGSRRIGEGDALRSERILSVMTDTGAIEVLSLGTDTVLDILDEAMREKLRDAANVSGRGRTDDIRSIMIALSGEGNRAVGLSYVVPAPVWKTAYRVVTGEGNTARLQAWEVVENATGEDWRDVALTLSSGAPVTLAQSLHRRYWHQRPAEAKRDVSATERDLERAVESQMRIRDNLTAVPADSALGQRYVSMLEEEENGIATLTRRRREAEEKARRHEDEVAAFIRGL